MGLYAKRRAHVLSCQLQTLKRQRSRCRNGRGLWISVLAQKAANATRMVIPLVSQSFDVFPYVNPCLPAAGGLIDLEL
jgi:hypothetical protein